MIVRLLAPALLLAFAGSTAAAPPADVADLFPPDTLAYAELHDPAALGPDVAALVKGSALEDSVALIEGRKAAAKTIQDLNGKRELAGLALLASPELLVEFRKLGGVAAGVVGFSERGEPEMAVAVLTGDSAAAGFAARAFLTTSAGIRKVADVSKVPLYQSRPPSIQIDQDGTPKLSNDKAPTEGPYEPTYAYVPGLFVVGTSKAALAPLIKRFRGEEKQTLRGTAGFQAAAAEYRKPGVFFYATPPGLSEKANAAGRARGQPFDSELLAWLKITTNPKALRTVAGCLRVRDEGVLLAATGTFDPALKSPLLDLLSGPPVKVAALHHARKPASFAATVNLPEKNRAAVLLGVLDAAVKSTGEVGRLPSDVVKDLQTKHKLPVTDELLAKVRAVTVVLPSRQELPKDAKPMPLVVFHLDDAAAAAAWEEFLPKLVGEMAGDAAAPQPASELVGGVKVRSLPGAGLPWKSALHSARKDDALAVGQDRKLVAAAVAADAAGSVAGGNRPLVVPAGEFALLGAVNLGSLAVAAADAPPAPDGPGRPWNGPGRFRPRFVPQPPEEDTKELDAARAAFLTGFADVAPATLTVRRAGDELRFELFQPKVLNGGFVPVIAAGVNWFDRLMGSRGDDDGNFPNSGF